jgi:hypothetical protein
VPLVCAAFAVVGDAAGAGHMGYGLRMMTSCSISLSDFGITISWLERSFRKECHTSKT